MCSLRADLVSAVAGREANIKLAGQNRGEAGRKILKSITAIWTQRPAGYSEII